MTQQESPVENEAREFDKMKIDIIKNEDKVLKFSVEGSTPAFANAIRRTSMNHVPILAIEDVAIHKNGSALFDEMLAQRLGQVPLKFDPDKYNLKEECDCEEGCAECQVKFTLQKEGPGKVYSGDLVCESAAVEPVYDGIPITELNEGQEVELEATAIVSTGKDHSKHQAAVTSYQYYPKITIDQDNVDDAETCVEICPANVFTAKNGKLKIDELENCTLCKECVENCKDGAIGVEGDDKKFILSLESISGLTPKKILEITTDILERKSNEVVEKLE
ncbi:MAG: DNA-directed RNA polymerase subunit D [Candidatus Aenigmatarchaeota archaeon]